MNLFEYKLAKASLNSTENYHDILGVIKAHHTSLNKYRFMLCTEALSKYKKLFKKRLAHDYTLDISNHARSLALAVDTYEDFNETFQYVTEIFFRSISKSSLVKLIDVIGTNPLSQSIVISGTINVSDWLLDSSFIRYEQKVLITLELLNKPDHTLVKHLQSKYDNSYDKQDTNTLLSKTTSVITAIKAIQKRNTK